MTFKDLALAAPLLDALQRQGYTHPTPIQQQSIPHILNGKDIFGCAQTGTGKTAAFALPILQMLSTGSPAKRAIRALILAPTRELALQIGASFSEYGQFLNIRHLAIFGGVSQNMQTTELRKGVDVLIATPGRLQDLMQQGFISLNRVEYFVLDEADRMLDMGFIHDIKRIVPKLPAKRQNIMFSATMPPEILKLSANILSNPVHVSVSPVSSTATEIHQSVFFVSKENKSALLKHILKQENIAHALIFTRTKRGADKVAKDLNKSGFKADAIHGNKSQTARVKALKNFKDRSINILVATDIASRGIDVEKLSHVINFEIPEQAETYVHRIGRTGRAGEQGTALSFCTSDEVPYLKDIHKLIRKNIEVVKNHPFAN